MNSFQSFWNNNYGDLPPINYVLRDYFFDDKWFRIHSLPNSKRYADNEKEMKVILERQNELISDLIGENYILLTSDFSETPSELNIQLNKMFPDDYDSDYFINLSITSKKWSRGSIDTHLRAVANDEIRNLLIIDTNQNRIIAPYDGGVDVFLNTTHERDYYKAKYKKWLSSTNNGL